jgi:7-cyano-7-deazaguanine reductase
MPNNTNNNLNESPLGKTSAYIDQYDNTLIFPIPREIKRQEIDVPMPLPFYGYDTWNAYELSWLNEKGKPMVAIARFDISCQSKCIIESKSFKLYLNSFNNSKFSSIQEVQEILKKDIGQAAQGDVRVQIFRLADVLNTPIQTFDGYVLDDLDIECDGFEVDPTLLEADNENSVSESFVSHLLKSNCLVTGQPDWGSVHIAYTGPKINRESILKYIVSFRNHNEFHEQCVERLFMDISNYCQPECLTVSARYTRRGGLDINPTRSSSPIEFDDNIRMARQ